MSDKDITWPENVLWMYIFFKKKYVMKNMALSFEMKKKVFQTLSRGDKSRYCVSMNKSYMLQILKKLTWLIPTILFTINMQSLTIHLCKIKAFILPNPLHNILKISSGHGISNNVIQKYGQRYNKVANHIFQTQCTMGKLKNWVKSSQLWRIISLWILAQNLPNLAQSCLNSPKTQINTNI